MPTLTECLQSDHRRLDAIFVECKALASAGSFPAAALRFATFAQGLSRHIDAEEEVLFPALAAWMPDAAGPTHVMKLEHERIREVMAAIAGAFEKRDAAWKGLALELEEVLGAHNLKEERVLYPAADESSQGAPDVEQVRGGILRLIG